MIRLKDIANESGVSIRTVSRVLKDNGYVSEEVRKKVQKVLDQHHYSPNIFASGLKDQKTCIIGVVAYSLDILANLLKEIQVRLKEQNYQLLLTIADDDKTEFEAIKRYYQLCDGIIFIREPGKKTLSFLENQTVPYLLVGNPNYPALFINRQTGIYQAFEHVRKRAFSTYIFITLDPSLTCYKRDAFEKLTDGYAKKVFTCKPITNYNQSYAEGYKLGDSIAKYPNSLVFAYSDKIAMGLQRRLHEQGCEVPKEYAIFGYNDEDFSEFSLQSISTIHLPIAELADRTVSHIKTILQGKINKEMDELETYFVARETTDGCLGADV